MNTNNQIIEHCDHTYEENQYDVVREKQDTVHLKWDKNQRRVLEEVIFELKSEG